VAAVSVTTVIAAIGQIRSAAKPEGQIAQENAALDDDDMR